MHFVFSTFQDYFFFPIGNRLVWTIWKVQQQDGLVTANFWILEIRFHQKWSHLYQCFYGNEVFVFSDSNHKDMSTCGILRSIGSDLTRMRVTSDTNQHASKSKDLGNTPTSTPVVSASEAFTQLLYWLFPFVSLHIRQIMWDLWRVKIWMERVLEFIFRYY